MPGPVLRGDDLLAARGRRHADLLRDGLVGRRDLYEHPAIALFLTAPVLAWSAPETKAEKKDEIEGWEAAAPQRAGEPPINWVDSSHAYATDQAQALTEWMDSFFGEDLPTDTDVTVAGAILADVGKLLEYDIKDGKSCKSETGKYLRNPFTGVALAMEAGVPENVCHIIAAHAGEGDMVKRTPEAYVVHHADFMTFLPFKNK